MSILYAQNIRTANNTEPLQITTGGGYPQISINSAISTINISASNVFVSSSNPFVDSIWVQAHQMNSKDNNVNFQQIQTSISRLQYFVWSFDPSLAQNGCQFTIQLPENWNRGNINCSLILSQRTNSTGNAIFSVKGTALQNSISLDSAQGTPCNIAVPMGTANTLYVSNNNHYVNSSGLSIGNLNSTERSPMVYFEVNRIPSDPTDTIAVDARLHGIEIKYTLKENL